MTQPNDTITGTLACLHCGKMFTLKEKRRDPERIAKYCSPACRSTARGLGAARMRLGSAEQLRRLYVNEQRGIGGIARLIGVGHRSIQSLLVEYGIPQRTQAEDKAIQLARLTPEERESLMQGCRDATRGGTQTDEHRFKIARTKQERAVLSGDEAEIMAGFNAAGLFPVPLFAIHRYNIDFAFPDAKLAIEYNGGNWHNTPKKRREDEIKRAWLEANGWTVVFFPRIDKPQANNAGNERITVHDLVSKVVSLYRLHLVTNPQERD